MTAIIKTIYRATVNSAIFEFKNVLELKRFLEKYVSGASSSGAVVLQKVVYSWDDSSKNISSTPSNLTADDLK